MARRAIDLTRRQGRKSPREAVLILCEGETEVSYFNQLKVYCRDALTVTVYIDSDHSSPKTMIKTAIRKLRDQHYDKVFCVFDGDDVQQVQDAQNLARRQTHIQLVISNPCIELWFILHFKYTSRHYQDCAGAKSHLGSLWPGYRSGGLNNFSILMPLLKDAVHNAEHLDEECLEDQRTEIHSLINGIFCS
jgi:hypothetical protein